MMSCAEYLAPLAPLTPVTLIDRVHFSAIQHIAHILPNTLAQGMFGFECRLGEEIPGADFALSISTGNGGRDGLAELNLIGLPVLPLYAHSIWERIHAFAIDWSDRRSPLYDGMDNIWLEFDVDTSNTGIPIPNIFFGPQAPHSISDHGSRFRLTLDAFIVIAKRAITLLTGQELAGEGVKMLEACFLHLPDYARIYQIGVMLARKTDTLRLCITGIIPAEIIPYLARIGWPDTETARESELAATLQSVAGYIDFIDLHIDVGETVLPKIGLECHIRGLKQPKYDLRWPIFLDYLVHQGLALPGKRDGLLAFPGYARTTFDSDLWPVSLQTAASLMSGRADSIFVRGLHHLKIIFQADKPLEAKAYLFVMHRWVNLAAGD